MQRIFILLLFLCIYGVFLSCMSAEFIKTGDEFIPLAENEEVLLFTSSNPQLKYQTIGLLRIRGGKFEDRVGKAKQYAMKKGGNGIIAREVGILTEPGTDNVIEKIGTSTYETQEFVIIKYEGDISAAKIAQAEAAKSGDQKEDSGLLEKGSIDYSTVPRATYKQLISDYKSLQGNIFQGSLYPKKIFKIPSSLNINAQAGDRLILLTTKSQKNKLYLMINKDQIPDFRKKISSGELMDFVYSPLDVYKTKEGTYPVIKFVEEIPKEAK